MENRMFGYVVIDKPEIKFKDYDIYRAYYCGLCKELQKGYGFKGQITLTYDLTFLSILLSSLYDCENSEDKERCIVHPLSKHPTIRNKFSTYSADMNILLSYYKGLDSWKDDRKLKGKILSDALRKSGKKISRKYPEKSAAIHVELERINSLEKENCGDIDEISGCFGRLMSVLFEYREDEWSKELKQIGFYLGKFIYILDAYIDYADDVKNKNYNPFIVSGYDKQYINDILVMMMAKCCESFERLPIVDNAEILRNILYSGVWVNLRAAENKKHSK